jgi:hypothetical protein
MNENSKTMRLKIAVPVNAGWPPIWNDGCLKADALTLCQASWRPV